MKKKTELNPFIDTMGPGRSRIPIVYPERNEVISEEYVSDRRKSSSMKIRYDNGGDVVFKCLGCGELIGQGRETGNSEDRVKIYCFKCKGYHETNNALIWSRSPLWHKPENPKQREDYEKIMAEFIEKKPVKELLI